jgi:hypothetical protein
MTLADLIKPGVPLEADGITTVYETGTGKVVAQYEGLEIHNKLLQADTWRKEREALLQMTNTLDEHPEGYEGPCLCKLCCSYSGELPKGN